MVIIATADALLGVVSWQILNVVAPDLVFAAFFYGALQDLQNITEKDQAEKKKA